MLWSRDPPVAAARRLGSIERSCTELRALHERTPPTATADSINDSTLPSVCYTVIYMVRVWLGLG